MSPEDTKPTRHHHPMKLIAVVLFWILALYLAVLFLRKNEMDSSELEFSRPSIQKPLGACTSPECITMAHQLHNWQDISVDPCQNFYQAVCGKYEEHDIEPYNRSVKKLAIIKKLLRKHLEIRQPTSSKSENTMRAFYQKCQESALGNATETRKAIIMETIQTIKEIGSWHLIDSNWNETSFDLNDMLSKFASLGMTNFGFFEVSIDSNRNVNISSDDAKFHLMYRVYMLNQTVVQFNEDLFRAVLGPDIKDVMQEEEELLKEFYANLATVVGKNPETNPSETIGFSELQSIVPSVDFERIMRKLMNPAREDKVWNGIKNKILVSKQDELFYGNSNVDKVLTTTRKRVLANFLIFNYITYKAFEADKENTIMKTVGCLDEVIETFPLAAIRFLARNHFDKGNLEIASGLVEEVKKSFIEIIQSSTWLSDSTKKNAIKKVEMMGRMIGYPEELEAPGALDSFFDSLNFSIDDSFHAMLNKVKKFQAERLMDFGASVFPMMASKDYFGISAFYDSETNELTLPVSFLTPPIFDSTYPMHVKIASIGRSIGHEIGHGFDPKGRKRDGTGKKNDWWTPENSMEYEKRAQCLVDQYNEYDDPTFGRNLNGAVTIQEMVADIFGVITSFKTYKRLHLSQEQHIIGFEDYDTDKLFFRISAMHWCRGNYGTLLSEQLKLVHPTASFRVNGVFSNIKSFAEAYNCPVGSPMNPEKKCELF